MPDSWGSFMNKPARGWLHPDNVITRSSVCYEVRVNFHKYLIIGKINFKKMIKIFSILVVWKC